MTTQVSSMKAMVVWEGQWRCSEPGANACSEHCDALVADAGKLYYYSNVINGF